MGATVAPVRSWVGVREVLGGRVLVLVGLWGLAVVQPLLDVFGSSPEFFVANGLTRAEIVAFGLAVTLVGPIVLAPVELAAAAVRGDVGQGVHSFLVTVLGTALGLNLLGATEIDDSTSVLLLGALAGIALASVEHVSAPLRTGLRYLSLSPLLFLAVFCLVAPTAELLRGDATPGHAAVETTATGPVVVLSLDEFPLASLLRADGTINAERFPNFARLAATSSWFRNATSVSADTTQSVPALMTGMLPEAGLLPTARDHPRSIFTLLAEDYDQRVIEQITDVCPDDLCPEGAATLDRGRLRTALLDAAVVYAHVSLPASLRGDLPEVDRAWGDFLGEEAGAVSGPAVGDESGAEQFVDPSGEARPPGPDPSCPRTRFWCGPALVSEMVESVGADSGPVLYFTHAAYPHSPWTRSPEGHQYAPPGVTPGVDPVSLTWSPAPAFAREGLQRHLMAVGYTDRLLGRLRSRLEAQGQWEDALVVVVADHGIAFEPGLPPRVPTAATAHELYNIPLFIKAPGQSEGEVREDNALNVDVLPTIVDLADIDVDWDFDGESLVAGGAHRDDKPVLEEGGWTSVPTDFDGVLEVVRRNERVLAFGNDWLGVAAFGPYGELVGAEDSSVRTTGAAGMTVQVDEATELAEWAPGSTLFAPLLLHGALGYGDRPAPSDALVTLNGRIAGVAVFGDPLPDGGLAFTALLAEPLLADGGNDVALLVPVSAGARRFHEVPPGP